MKKSYKALWAAANAEIEAIPAAEAIALLSNEEGCFIDIRNSAELALN